MRPIITTAVVAAALGLACTTFAKQPKTAGGEAPQKTKVVHEKPVPSVTENATITKVEGANITLSIQVTADANTRVMVDGQLKTISELKPGQNVTVALTESGLASITVKGSGDSGNK